jgi:hypothetical protein
MNIVHKFWIVQVNCWHIACHSQHVCIQNACARFIIPSSGLVIFSFPCVSYSGLETLRLPAGFSHVLMQSRASCSLHALVTASTASQVRTSFVQESNSALRHVDSAAITTSGGAYASEHRARTTSSAADTDPITLVQSVRVSSLLRRSCMYWRQSLSCE